MIRLSILTRSRRWTFEFLKILFVASGIYSGGFCVVENNSEKISETIKTQKHAAQEKKALSNLALQLTSTILTTPVIWINLDFQEEYIFFQLCVKNNPQIHPAFI